MPEAIFLKGCGLMACSTYAEVAAAVDKAYAVPADQPLPVDQVFAGLAPPANPEQWAHKAGASPPPAPVPEPG